MLTLNFTVDNFDQDNTFKFQYEGRKGAVNAVGYLFNSVQEGKIYIMKKSACLQGQYSKKDHEEMDRIAIQNPVKNGDTVLVDNTPYKVVILGNYSDAGYLVKA